MADYPNYIRGACKKCGTSERYANGDCKSCAKRRAKAQRASGYPKIWREKYHDQNLARMRDYRKTLKQEVFAHYSDGLMACVCCGEDTPEFLALDHITPVGRGHKGKTKTGEPRGSVGLWSKLRKLGFPDGYRILCRNCNLGRALNNGICPHEDSSVTAA